MTLRTRLTFLVVILITSVVVIVSGYFTYRNAELLSESMTTQSIAMKEELTSKARALAVNVGVSSRRALLVADYLFLQQVILSTVTSDPDLVYGIIMNDKREALVHSEVDKTSKVLEDAAAYFAVEQTALSQYEFTLDDQPIMEIINPVFIADEQWTIRLGVSFEELNGDIATYRSEITERIKNDVLVTIALALFLMAIASILGVVAASRLASPLQNLMTATNRIAGGDLDIQLDRSGGGPELDNLASAFNVMLAAIRSRDDEIRTNIHSLENEVSERKLAEKELGRLQRYLRNIIDSMPSTLVAVDAEGKIMQWNRGAEDETSLSAEEVTGRVVGDVFPILADKMEVVSRAIRERKPQTTEKVISEKDNDYRIMEVTVYPLAVNGVEGAVFRVDNVTEKARLEQLLIQSEKMMSVGGLAAGMAHEINNPLAGILQNAQVLTNRLSATLDKNIRVAEHHNIPFDGMTSYMEERGIFKLVKAITDSASRAAKIVSNMLAFSRKADAQHSLCDLAELVDNTLELAANDYDLKKKYDFRKIEIIKQFDPDTPKVSCERGEIQQVLLNLLKNGAHAMSESTDSTTTPRFTIRTRKSGESVDLDIEDNGPGMPPEIQRRIFEPFFTTKDVGVGTGLGLSVSYFIVKEQHGGQISVASTPGQGARFTVTLPIDSLATRGASS